MIEERIEVQIYCSEKAEWISIVLPYCLRDGENTDDFRINLEIQLRKYLNIRDNDEIQVYTYAWNTITDKEATFEEYLDHLEKKK